MRNEMVLIISLIITYGMVLIFYKSLGKVGLYMWSAIATIVANIEVAILINAFGLEQTLGNILFASTFLATDILSENYDKKSANKAVKIGILSNIVFVFLSRLWFFYIPASSDTLMPHLKIVFANTPRFIIVGITVYAICQAFDVWLYHFIWNKTEKYFGDSKKGLYLRNNLSTLCSQFINTILFTFGAFFGVLKINTMINIFISSYLIYIATSLLDTPIIYFARKIKDTVQE